MTKKTLVTGADGFIGSHVVQSLVSSGHDVRALVHYNSRGSIGWLSDLPKNILSQVDVFPGDIRDYDRCAEAVKGCKNILHLAALIGIPYSYHTPHSYIETNVKGTLNLLQSAKTEHIECFIHTSTSEVYGTAQTVPISESHPLVGQSPYSASKIAADHLAFSFFSSFDLPVVIIRPFNTYGPRQSNRAVIPAIISQILAGREKISLGATSPTRDFSYIDDTVEGLISPIGIKQAIGKTINLGAGFEISIHDTAILLAKIMGKPITIVGDEKRERPIKSEVNRLFSDNRLANKVLNWTPKFAGIEGFEHGLSKTTQWFLVNKDNEKYKDDSYAI